MKISRPLLTALALMVAALYLGIPHAAVVTLLMGALVGFLIGSVNGTGAEFSILALGMVGVFGIALTASSFDLELSVQIPLSLYAGVGWFAGLTFVGVVSLLSRK